MQKFYKYYKHLKWKVIRAFEITTIYLPVGYLGLVIFKKNVYKLRKNGPLGKGGVIHLVPDRVTRPFINRFGFQDIEVSKFLVDSIQSCEAKNKLLIDIGANQGLQTLQIVNLLESSSLLDIICIEPYDIFFQMLKKNLEHIPNNITLINMAVDVKNSKKLIWSSKRNATATLDKKLCFDKPSKLYSQYVASLNVNSLISKYINLNELDCIFVKSDTDGSDISIFNALLDSPLKFKIKSYALEIIFSNFSNDQKVLFLKNIEKFSTWILLKKNGTILVKKAEIKSYILNGEGSDIINIFLT